MRRVSALLVVCLVSATACGSTVPTGTGGSAAAGGPASEGAQGLQPDDGLALDPGSGASGEGAGAQPAAGGGGRGGAGAPPASTPAAGGEGGDGGGGVPADQGSGSTAPGGRQQPGRQEPGGGGGKIRLGLVVPSGDPARAFGASSQPEDYPQIAKALVEDLNQRGGLGGRTVEAVIREASQDDQSQEAQTRQANEICQSLTQDTTVDLVTAVGNTGTFYAFQCYASARTPVLTAGAVMDDSLVEQFAPWVLPPWSQNITTVAAELPGQLRRRGVLTKKIGILAFDVPQVRRAVEETFKPAIRRNGGAVLETVYMNVSYQDVGAGVSSAVLRFKSLGVDLVLPSFAPGGGVTGIFMHEAETQQFRPKYGLSSMDAPIIIDTTLNAPPQQLANSMGFGSNPILDVEQSELPPSRNERRCWNAVNKRLGTNYSNRNFGQGNGMAALELCDLLWEVEAALAPIAGQRYDRTRVKAAVEALGTSYTPVSLPASRFAPGRADGSAVQREFYFDANGCQCFTYRGKWLPVRR